MAQQMAGRAREGAGNAMGGCLGEVGDGSWEEEGRGRGGGGWWGWTIAVCHLRLLAGSVLCAGSGHRRREITTVWDDDHEQNDERRFRDHIIGGWRERENVCVCVCV